ncbi:MAG: hypothetical protein KDD49_05665, partial [Bacteroidetes bacterium]|nr:hypothetical protein [Bacteroidota bacterium]
PLLLKRKFLIPFLAFTIFSAAFSGYNLYYSNNTNICPNDSRKRIVVLLPLDKTKSNQPAYQDGKRQAYGLIDLIEKKSDILKNYDIVFRNHEMDETRAVEIVSDELKNGTNYFISTMSHISERLSKDFESLIKQNRKRDLDKPKLIVTVSSSSKIQVHPNSVYRFYIRSNEESSLLADYATKNGVNERLVAIVVDDNYGRRAQEVFNESYGKPFDITIPLSISWTKDKIKSEISKKVASNGVENTFFIVHYGSGLDNIVSSISELRLSGNFLISHPITVDEWHKPVENILNSRDWVTCSPEAADGGIYVSEDIIRDFVYFSIHRLINTIEETSYSSTSFDTAWRNSNEPQRIKYEITSEGDSEIKMKLEAHNKE